MSHSKFSPSSAKRWMTCTASLGAIAALPRKLQDSSGTAAVRGTALHLLSEHLIAADIDGAISDIDPNTSASIEVVKRLQDEFKDDDEGLHTVEMFLNHIRFMTTPSSQVYTEIRAGYESLVPGGFGTVDAVVVTDDHLTIIDLKTGRVPVDADDNPQLKIYALAVIETLELTEIKSVTLAISQNGVFESANMTIGELNAFSTEVSTAGRNIIIGDVEFKPSKAACHYCPVQGSCAAYSKQIVPNNLRPVLNTLPAVHTLTHEQAIAIASNALTITKYVNSVKEHLKGAMESGESYLDVGLREMKGRDKVDVEALKALDNPALFETKPIGITKLRKVLSHEQLQQVLITGEPTNKVVFELQEQQAKALPFEIF